ncbi:MAG: hypothetical protein IH841_04130 [Thaumarchaeota archaeon]|nr:hypothetical protein [Nitrososphaerota archaeon]
MKLTKCSIYLLDFLQSNNKERFDEELSRLDGKFIPEKETWKNIPIAKGKRNEFTLTTIPSELAFCEKIKIVLIQHENISSVIMLTIEGELSSQLLEIIETQDFVENKNFLEKYQKELWKFWKEKISSTILIKNELTNLDPLAINNFKFDVDDYKEFLLEIENAVNEAKESTTINKLISKYGTNTLGPTSVLNISDKSLSIFSQNRWRGHTNWTY